MSSKTIKFAYNKVYNLTYDNIDDWPSRPEYRTFNNKSLIFCPNSACSITASTDPNDNWAQLYQTTTLPYLTDFVNMGMQQYNNLDKTLFHIEKYITSVSGGQFQDFTSTNGTITALYDYMYTYINTTDNDCIICKNISNGVSSLIYSAKPIILNSDTLSLTFTSEYKSYMNLYELVLDNGNPIISELVMEQIEAESNTYTIQPNNRIFLLLLSLSSSFSFPQLSEGLQYQTDTGELNLYSAVFSVFAPIGDYETYFPELKQDTRFDRWTTDQQLPMEDLYSRNRSGWECHQTHVGKIVDYINEVTNPSSLYIPYEYITYRWTGTPCMTFYRLSDQSTANNNGLTKTSSNRLIVSNSILTTIQNYYDKRYEYIILVDYG